MRRRLRYEGLERAPVLGRPAAGRTASALGAYVAPDKVRRGQRHEPLPIPFDLPTIIASPTTGTTTTLLGPGASIDPGPVPTGYRAYVDAICPYVEGVAGQLPPGRIPGTGVTITWRLSIDNRPAPFYGAITSILADWERLEDRPLLELPEGAQLAATVTYVDPLGLYSFVGVRIRGVWRPWKVGE